jgi:hypothetical protein
MFPAVEAAGLAEMEGVDVLEEEVDGVGDEEKLADEVAEFEGVGDNIDAVGEDAAVLDGRDENPGVCDAYCELVAVAVIEGVAVAVIEGVAVAVATAIIRPCASMLRFAARYLRII